jgi:hypothetical protein
MIWRRFLLFEYRKLFSKRQKKPKGEKVCRGIRASNRRTRESHAKAKKTIILNFSCRASLRTLLARVLWRRKKLHIIYEIPKEKKKIDKELGIKRGRA